MLLHYIYRKKALQLARMPGMAGKAVLACLGSLGSIATCCSAAQGAKASTAFRYFGRYFGLCKRTLKKLDFFQEFCRKLRNNPDPIVRLPLLLMEAFNQEFFCLALPSPANGRSSLFKTVNSSQRTLSYTTRF